MKILQGAKYIWQIPDFDQVRVAEFSATYNLSYPIIQTLLSRGLKDKSELDQFLTSSYEKDVASSELLKDGPEVARRIIEAIDKQEKILICGDYDVDGITSSAMMMACLKPLGAQINFFLPHRVNDGYGLSVKTVRRAAQNGYKVLITVDNGITAFEPALEAKKLGIDLIITDHHRPHDHLPEGFAVVDPHRVDCEYPYKKFAGVGVGFKILSLVYKYLGLELPEKVYELLLLGTVADVVPITGENRFWVRHCLNLINDPDYNAKSLALRVLKENARVTKPILSSTDIGFFLAPQINALGRLDDPRQGVAFLISDNEEEVRHVGRILKELNESRKGIEKGIFNQVETLIKSGEIDISTDHVLVAAGSWPPGVIGLVASRLVGAYARPAIVLHLTSDGLAKGSCRSVKDFNMFNALSSCSDLLLSFGGHAAAAGMSLDAKNLPELKSRLNILMREQLPDFDFKHKLSIDSQLVLPEANKKLMSDLQYLEPFGCENQQPVFYVKDVSIVGDPVLLKEAHVKCSIFADGIIKPVIFFNRPEIFKILEQNKDKSYTIAVHVSENHWNDKVSIELQGVDILL